MNHTTTRNEHDFLGDMPIPAAAYWGVHSARAVDNFAISGQTVGDVADLVREIGRASCRERV